MVVDSVSDLLDDVADAVNSAVATNVSHNKAPKIMKARQVPVGGVFEYKDELFIRSSGKGRVTKKKFTTLERPCVGVSLEGTGDVVGLEEAEVTYFPSAKLLV